MFESTKPARSRAFWPDTSYLQGAIDASRQGMWACCTIAGITTLMALIAIAGTSLIAGLDGFALIDAALFGLSGWGISKFSRTAAVFALSLFTLEKIFAWSQGGPRGVPLAVIMFLLLISGVRGTFAYHRLSRQQPDIVTGPGTAG